MPTKILYTVLNWGLGHASRSIPVIKALLAQQVSVVIASDGDALLLLQKEFPQLTLEPLPSYNVQYAKKAKDFDKTIFLQLGRLGKVIQAEHALCKQLVQKHSITHIISDNRYGCYDDSIPSAMLCHQINLQHRSVFTQKIMNKVHFGLLKNFDTLWIPDFEGDFALAGNISKTKNAKLKSKLHYIGALSRFTKCKEKPTCDVAIVLSGPEPQRSILEEILYAQTKALSKKIIFVRGISKPQHILSKTANIEVHNLLQANALNKILCQSAQVVCRAGYSSIMDLVQLHKKALLIPTPGQTEQEYLAKRLHQRYFLCQNQNQLNLQIDLKKLEQFTPQKQEFPSDLLTRNIKLFLAK